MTAAMRSWAASVRLLVLCAALPGILCAAAPAQAADPSADLSLTNADSPDPVHNGDNITYTLTATNGGPDAAADVTISDTLPSSVVFVSASSGCTLTPEPFTAGRVICSVGTLASGANAVRTITVQTITAHPSLNNMATVSSSTGDPDTPDRTAIAVTTVNPAASLSLSMTDSSDPAERGEELVYTLTVANTGPDAADGISVTDSLPSGVVFNTASSGCSHSSGTVTCGIPQIPSGNSHDFHIVVRPTNVGQISNAAVASTTTHDRSTGNDSDTETTQVVDTVAPTPTLTDPAQSSTTTDATPRFAGSTNMKIGDSSTVMVKVYTGHAQTQQDLPATPTRTLTTTQNAGSYEVTPSDALPNGQYTAQAEQSDNGGNTGKSGLVRFTVNAPPPPPPDSDGDGIIDSEDSCPSESGQPQSPSNANGCPRRPPPDTDGDGYVDSVDSCPTLSGPGSNTGGCPPPGTPTFRTDPVQFTPQGILFKASGNLAGHNAFVRFEISAFEGFKNEEGGGPAPCEQKTGVKELDGTDRRESSFRFYPFEPREAWYRDGEVTCHSEQNWNSPGRKMYVRAVIELGNGPVSGGVQTFVLPGGGGGGGGASSGTNANDTLNGTDAAETICGLLGNDVVNAAGGNDTVFGDICNVKAKPVAGAQAGAGGNDTLNGGTGNDTVYGAGGADKLFGGDGNDKLFGGDGNDSLSGGKGKDSLDGGKGNDKLNGGADVNTYKGGTGDDTINAKNGKRETVDCGAGKKDSASVDKADKVKGCEKVKRAKK